MLSSFRETDTFYSFWHFLTFWPQWYCVFFLMSNIYTQSLIFPLSNTLIPTWSWVYVYASIAFILHNNILCSTVDFDTVRNLVYCSVPIEIHIRRESDLEWAQWHWVPETILNKPFLVTWDSSKICICGHHASLACLSTSLKLWLTPYTYR